MDTLPPLLETYEEARLLLEAKGWGIAKAAEHLSELPDMARFHLSHTKLSHKTKPGSAFPIEPEVAAAVEGLETWRGYEQQTEIVTTGLRARRGTRPAVQVPPSVRQRVMRALRKLAQRLARASWRPVAVTAASGALVGCLVLMAAGVARPGPLMLVLPGARPDGSAVR